MSGRIDVVVVVDVFCLTLSFHQLLLSVTQMALLTMYCCQSHIGSGTRTSFARSEAVEEAAASSPFLLESCVIPRLWMMTIGDPVAEVNRGKDLLVGRGARLCGRHCP